MPGFPAGPVVESLPANAGGTGLTPGPGGSSVSRGNYTRAPQLPTPSLSTARGPRPQKPPRREAGTLQRSGAPTRCRRTGDGGKPTGPDWATRSENNQGERSAATQAVMLLILDHGCQGPKANGAATVYTVVWEKKQVDTATTRASSASPGKDDKPDLVKTAPHPSRGFTGLTKETYFFPKKGACSCPQKSLGPATPGKGHKNMI